MDAIKEVITISFSGVNLPLTVLLMLVLVYWGMVILGIFHLEDGDVAGDVGVDADVHVDTDLDMDTDVHMDTDMHVEADTDTSLEGHEVGEGTAAEVHGPWTAVLGFLGFGQLPAMVILSVLILSVWFGSVALTHYINPQQHVGIGLLLLLPIVLIAIVITRYLTLPLKKIYAMLNQDYDRAPPIIGQVCQVTTSEVTAQYGQGAVVTRGAPIILQIRALHDEVLRKGDQAIVIAQDKKTGFYRVTKFNQPKLEE